MVYSDSGMIIGYRNKIRQLDELISKLVNNEPLTINEQKYVDSVKKSKQEAKAPASYFITAWDMQRCVV